MIRSMMARIDALFTGIAAAALAGMALLVVADVLLRYGAAPRCSLRMMSWCCT